MNAGNKPVIKEYERLEILFEVHFLLSLDLIKTAIDQFLILKLSDKKRLTTDLKIQNKIENKRLDRPYQSSASLT